MTQSLVCPHTVSRVSSVLNRNTQQFGKKHLFDQEEETCWNSDQLQIQFQGGFSSRRGLLEGSRRGDTLNKILEFYPEDNNSLQTFPVPTTVVDQLKVTFKDPTDLFGRVVIYHLRVMGEKVL
ncbi:nuclear receptor 2C2-associated protein isoform X2 [Perognathus longimembris pacificus]|uniref:nuclear receptor 2C2-associated protein isoform X2 n=1 Tax=Perognathus longimembris pacificus TaxID=214514 RepID=UPI002019F0F1|nr:nuclear receptor 2C2-associated protein isoform X2 [Perognathus longimembris pacificus]